MQKLPFKVKEIEAKGILSKRGIPGIDWAVMFLTNTWSVRETIAFPTLRSNPKM